MKVPLCPHSDSREWLTLAEVPWAEWGGPRVGVQKAQSTCAHSSRSQIPSSTLRALLWKKQQLNLQRLLPQTPFIDQQGPRKHFRVLELWVKGLTHSESW